ncbi:phosphodiesterase [Anaerococcus sp. WCA-380-WT-2B]|uniref:Phosphodiesterase n=1 Tax=Anaerococcus porci TaxID=2652269 RepID=A0A6N7VDQ2_9FIRM|nr:metallophosphoesterase [Anaerococcus porci]MSS77555.1 phosphodiesterase [Anaerococcus porci]
MRIFQISDTHVRGDGKLSFQKADTIKLLTKTVEYFQKLEDFKLPEFFVVSGDLSEGGKRDGYEYVKKALDALPRPSYILPGNHDKRDFFLDIFRNEAPVKEDIKPYICYSLEDYPVRIIVVDTSIPETHFGGLSKEVEKWLEARANEDEGKPTLVFTHHPPFDTGMTAMDEGFINSDKFAKLLKRFKKCKLCLGHLHVSMSTVWEGIPCVVAPSIAMQMEVDFRDKDGKDVSKEEKEDNFKGGGDRFYLGNPGYLIHELVNGNQINSYVSTIPAGADYSGPFPFKYYEGEH